MHIALINSVVANGGDAAILVSTIKVLRAAFGADASFVLYDAAPEVARTHYPELTVRPTLYKMVFEDRPRSRLARKTRFLRWLVNRPRLYAAAEFYERSGDGIAERLLSAGERKQLRELAQADLVCSVGGTYLVENYWLGPVFFEFGLVHRLRLPHVLLSQSMGPFQKPHVRRAMRKLLSEVELAVLRDEASLRHVEALGPISARLEVGADTAFAIAEAGALRAARTAAWPERPRVAVSVREWPYYETVPVEEGMARYRASIAATVEHLVRTRGAEVVFVSTCQGNPEYRYDDAAVAATIAATLPDDVRGHVSVDAAYHRPEALVDLLGGFDLVVATRMHVAILALSAGVPVLPIAYEFKTQALFDRLGLGEWVQNIERVRPDALPDVADRFIDALPSFRAGLFERVEGQRAEAMASGAWVRDAVRSGRENR